MDNRILMSFIMSETLANTFQERVEALCNRGIGDRERLQGIIEAIKKGKALRTADLDYVDELESQPQKDG